MLVQRTGIALMTVKACFWGIDRLGKEFVMKEKLQTVKIKFILLALVVCLIPTAIISIYSDINYNRMIEQRFSNITDNFLSVVDWNLKTITTDVEDISTILMTAPEIQKTLVGKTSESDLEKYQMKLRSRDLIINILNNKNYIDFICVGNQSINFFYEGSVYAQDEQKSLKQERYTEFLQTFPERQDNGKGSWRNIEGANYSENISLVYERTINNLNTIEPIGGLIIGINRKILDEMFLRTSNDISYNIIVLNDDEILYSQESDFDELDLQMILANGKQDSESGTFFFANGKKYLLNYMVNKEIGWTVIQYTPYEEVIKWNGTINLTFFLILGSFILSLAFAIMLSNKVTSQLTLLRYVIFSAKNYNKIPKVRFNPYDEVGIIGIEFLRTFKSNEELHERLLNSIVKEKEAELLALQSQINPHFLYNTLNSIYCMAQGIHADSIAKMVKNMSNFYRQCLNNGKLLVTVEEEVRLIEYYLEIQNIRYQGKFEAKIDIEEQMLSMRMIKLILQPVVENAFYHGLEAKSEFGHLSVNGRLSGEYMIFQIMDDGVGFNPEITSTGYALNNLQDRILLYYGETCGVKIESTPMQGTTVTIKIMQNICS